MMKLIRLILGKFILFLDSIFRPRAMLRDAHLQSLYEAEVQNWRLYELKSCPFCVKVRRELKRLNLPIVTKDIGANVDAHHDLMLGGKIDQVPCLMVPQTASTPAQWIYESAEIVRFLRNRFGLA